MKLSEQLKQDHESGDFGKALEGYSERAALMEDALIGKAGDYLNRLESGMKWQPLETSPETTRVLVWVPSYGPCTAKKTTTIFGSGWWNGKERVYPTHWMLISPPPRS